MLRLRRKHWVRRTNFLRILRREGGANHATRRVAMSTHHLKLFFPPPPHTHTHCCSDRKHDFPVRWLQWAWLSALYSYSFSTNANISELQLHRACLASGSEGRRFVRRRREQPQQQLLPLSLLFSFDKESSFCLSDFLCLCPSIEDKDHLSIKTH